MKGQVKSRPLTFLCNLLKFTQHLKSSFDLCSVLEANVPQMKDLIGQIDMSNLRNLVQAVEKHFILS